MDWMQTMVSSLVDKLTHALELTGSQELAIAYVKERTTAGPKAWGLALQKLGWGA